MGWSTNTPVQISLATDWSRSGPLQVLGSTLAGRVIGTRFGQSVCRVPGDFLRPQEAFPTGYYSLRRGWVNCPAPEAPLIRGMLTGPWAFWGNAGCVWATALRLNPPKKGLVSYLPVRWGGQQIPQSRSVWDQSRSTRLKSRFPLLKYIPTLSLILMFLLLTVSLL